MVETLPEKHPSGLKQEPEKESTDKKANLIQRQNWDGANVLTGAKKTPGRMSVPTS